MSYITKIQNWIRNEKSIFIIIISFIIGLGMGLAILQTVRVTLETLGITVVTWIGSGVGVLGLFRSYFKDKREEKNTPTLIFGEPIMSTFNDERNGGMYNYFTYYLPIENVRRDAVARDCICSISMGDSPLKNEYYAIWDKDGNSRSLNIGHSEYLKLFMVTEFHKDNQIEKSITIFRESGTKNLPRAIDMQYNIVIDCVVSVSVQSSNAKYPAEPFERSVRNIIETA